MESKAQCCAKDLLMFSPVFSGCSSAPGGVSGPPAVSPLPGVMPGRVLVSDSRLPHQAAYGSSASCGGLPPAGAPGAVTASNPPVPLWAATGERAASTRSEGQCKTALSCRAAEPWPISGSTGVAGFPLLRSKDRSRRIPARRHPASGPNVPRRKPFPCPVAGCEKPLR